MFRVESLMALTLRVWDVGIYIYIYIYMLVSRFEYKCLPVIL